MTGSLTGLALNGKLKAPDREHGVICQELKAVPLSADCLPVQAHTLTGTQRHTQTHKGTHRATLRHIRTDHRDTLTHTHSQSHPHTHTDPQRYAQSHTQTHTHRPQRHTHSHTDTHTHLKLLNLQDKQKRLYQKSCASSLKEKTSRQRTKKRLRLPRT